MNSFVQKQIKQNIMLSSVWENVTMSVKIELRTQKLRAATQF